MSDHQADVDLDVGAPDRDLEVQTTPPWWRGLSTRVQAALLATLLPGVLLHELTHALVAAPFADVTMLWDAVAVRLDWHPSAPTWARPAAHLAPLAVGWALGAGLLLVLVGTGYSVDVPLPMLLYGVAQWVLYTLAVLGDLAW